MNTSPISARQRLNSLLAVAAIPAMDSASFAFEAPRTNVITRTGVHRSTPNSKAGRQMTSGGGKEFHAWDISEVIRDWNAAIDAKKHAKWLAKKEKEYAISNK